MTAGYKNLCAEIPEALHAKVRQRQTESGISLSQYVTGLIKKYYEMEENLKMDKDNVRTVAFQVPVELFEQFKAYLKRNGVKQNAFFLNCIQQALAEDPGWVDQRRRDYGAAAAWSRRACCEPAPAVLTTSLSFFLPLLVEADKNALPPCKYRDFSIK